jgi:polar amino acid transport system substrate-binding protein
MPVDLARARIELAPTGVLRVALNDANFLLVRRDAQGEPAGLAPALAREIATRLDVHCTFLHYADAGLMADAVDTGTWDIGFLGIDADRAGIAFTQPYVEIDAGYLVPPDSALSTIDEVDRPGVRIAVFERSAYDLHLTRTLRFATLVRAPSIEASFQIFAADRLEALAGLKARLEDDALRLPGARVLDGRFTAIQQGIGTPASRRTGAAYLAAFVSDARSSGLLQALVQRLVSGGITIPEDPPDSAAPSRRPA